MVKDHATPHLRIPLLHLYNGEDEILFHYFSKFFTFILRISLPILYSLRSNIYFSAHPRGAFWFYRKRINNYLFFQEAGSFL